jgi:hypothetical protein
MRIIQVRVTTKEGLSIYTTTSMIRVGEGSEMLSSADVAL